MCRIPIYNSRNYKCLIDGAGVVGGGKIYNSRNYKCLIDWLQTKQTKVKSTIVEIISVL